MADHYTEFSFVVELPTLEAVQEAVRLYAGIVAARDADAGEELHSDNQALYEFARERLTAVGMASVLNDESTLFDISTISMEPESTEQEGTPCLWIHSDESGSVDGAAIFVQMLMRIFGLKDPVGFEWANTCSKLRVDSFGGGAIWVTAQEIDSCSSGDWLFEKRAAYMWKKK